jgi:hypothetical protein
MCACYCVVRGILNFYLLFDFRVLPVVLFVHIVVKVLIFKIVLFFLGMVLDLDIIRLQISHFKQIPKY